MKHIAIAVSVAVLVFGVAILAQTKSGSVEQELIKLEKEWGDALVKPDLAFLDRILAEDIIELDINGLVLTKTQMLENLKSKADVFTSLVTDEWKAHVYGDAGVVMGRNTVKEQYKGQDISGQYRWIDTWIKKSGRWQCVATVGVKVTPK